MITTFRVTLFIQDHWQKFVAAAIILCFGYFWWKVDRLQGEADTARIDAQNQIAQLSDVVRESNGSFSRLAQQAENSNEILRQLHAQNESLATLIQERDEQILQLTTAIGQIRPVNVVVRPSELSQTVIPPVTEGEPERTRVEFDTVHEDYLRIHGWTLSNPAEATVSVEHLRAINFTVATTQAQDGSWRTYLQSDLPNLSIGEIESVVTPLEQPRERRRIEQNIEVGLSALVATTGNSGAAQLDVGYDFGALELEIAAGGIVSPSGLDFGVGGRISVAPFDL